VNGRPRRTPIAAAPALLAALVLGALAARAADAPALKTTELGRGPTVVLVHELGSARMTWMPVVRPLITGHRVVLVDLPGHGESPMIDPFSFPAAAAALDGVLAREKPESTIVVGHGVGGVVALYEASAHPERMRGLVVLDAAATTPFKVADQQRDMFLKQLDERYDAFLNMMYLHSGRDSVQSVAIHARAALVPPATMKAYLRELLVLDATGAAKALKVPMLFVASEKTWAAESSWAGLAKKFGYDGVRDVSWRRIGASGHYMVDDQPDSVAAAIAAFETRAISGPRKP